MVRHVTALLILIVSCVTQAAFADSRCANAVISAERHYGIPSRLLDAISRVESGRPDGSGAVAAWPWTINAAGQGYFYDTKAQAIAAVRQFQASGIESIDVGCMQINLRQHPDAFSSLEEAFDPQTNTEYGASFLADLFQKLHGWRQATAAYHSLTPARGLPYAQRVSALWQDDDEPAEFSPPTVAHIRPYPVGNTGPPPRIIRRPSISASSGARTTPQQGHGLAFYRLHSVRVAFRR